LHIAAAMGRLDIVKQLLQWHPVGGMCKSHEINFNAVDATGSTALHLAASGGHEKVVEELLKYCKARNYACQGGLKSGLLDMAPTNKRRTTPLHLAALFGRPTVVSMLLKSGAPVNRTAFSGHTPLHYAVFSLCPKTVKAILREAEGLKVSEADWKGLTPLEYAKELCLDKNNGYTPTERKQHIKPGDSMEIMQMLEGFDVHGLHTDRQGYMDSANAILVCAALIAIITFSSWLQPPLGFPKSNHVAIEYKAMQAFWIFNSLSFFFAIATVIAGADAALPKKYQGLKDTVANVRGAVIRASWLLFLAVVGVIGAFACAAFVGLPTTRKDSWYMRITLLVGGMTCVCFLAGFVRKLLTWTDFSNLRLRFKVAQVSSNASSSMDSSSMNP
jgi:ankyrin repeat protein